MKKTRLLTVLLLSLTLLLTLPAMAEEQTVTVRFEGAESNLYFETLPLSGASLTVLDLLKQADNASESLSVEGLDAGYIYAVNGERAGRTDRGWDGFGVRLNGVYVPFDALDKTAVKSGDEILVYYADEFGEGLLVPILDQSDLTRGVLRFYAEIPDENGGYTVEAIAGAEVRWYCGDAYVSYVTDGNGSVKIDTDLLFSGDHRVGIELWNDEGVPLLLRPSPSFGVNVPTNVGDSPLLYVCLVLLPLSAAGILALTLTAKKRKVK